MNAMKQRVEEARQHWNAGDLAGYLTLYDEFDPPSRLYSRADDEGRGG